MVSVVGDVDGLHAHLAAHPDDVDALVLDIRMPPTHTDEGIRALEDLRRAGEELAGARERYLAGPVNPATSARANRILIGIERALARETGPFGDGEVRSLTFASDPRNGYATLALPGIATAVREGSRERVREEILDLAGRLGRAADRAREAGRVLGGGSP